MSIATAARANASRSRPGKSTETSRPRAFTAPSTWARCHTRRSRCSFPTVRTRCRSHSRRTMRPIAGKISARGARSERGATDSRAARPTVVLHDRRQRPIVVETHRRASCRQDARAAHADDPKRNPSQPVVVQPTSPLGRSTGSYIGRTSTPPGDGLIGAQPQSGNPGVGWRRLLRLLRSGTSSQKPPPVTREVADTAAAGGRVLA